jgi:hypothetical protein
VEMKLAEIKNRGGLSTIRKGTPDDLLCVCASFEPRTTTASECLGENYRAKNGVIYHNYPEVGSEVVKNNLEKLKELLKPKCDNVTVVEGSLNDPVKQFRAMKKAILEIGQSTSVNTITIDSTTFNREALLVAMALLRTNYPSSTSRILYVSPRKHGEWLTHGFREVRTIIGFPGILRSNRPTILVILTGFEPDRVTKIVEEHSPDKVLLGFGNPPTKQSFLERNIEEQKKTVFSKQEVERFEFPANSIEACHNYLETLLSGCLPVNNIILAPMSTKLSTIGALLTVEAHHEMQLTYCVPGEYNIQDYSRGIRSIFMETIPPKTTHAKRGKGQVD